MSSISNPSAAGSEAPALQVQPNTEAKVVSNNDTNNNMKEEIKPDVDAAPEAPKAGNAKRPRKRPSEVIDSSLVLETPAGADGNRRQTRSLTRGTPAPPPAKKVAAEKKTPAPKKAPAEKKGKKVATTVEKPVESTTTEVTNNDVEKTEDKVDGDVVAKPEDVPVVKEEDNAKPAQPVATTPATPEKPAPVEPAPAPVLLSVSTPAPPATIVSSGDAVAADPVKPALAPSAVQNNMSPQKQSPVPAVAAAAPLVAAVAPAAAAVAPTAASGDATVADDKA